MSFEAGTSVLSLHSSCSDSRFYGQVETLEAKAGRKGHIKLKGSLPVGPEAGQEASGHHAGLHLDVQALELRSRNLYTGTWPPGVEMYGTGIQHRPGSGGQAWQLQEQGLGTPWPIMPLHSMQQHGGSMRGWRQALHL